MNSLHLCLINAVLFDCYDNNKFDNTKELYE